MISLKFIEIPHDSKGSKLTRPRTQAVRAKEKKIPTILYKEEEEEEGGFIFSFPLSLSVSERQNLTSGRKDTHINKYYIYIYIYIYIYDRDIVAGIVTR